MPSCTDVIVTDPTGAEITACTVEPAAWYEGRNIPISDRPSAPEDQLIGPACGDWWDW